MTDEQKDPWAADPDEDAPTEPEVEEGVVDEPETEPEDGR